MEAVVKYAKGHGNVGLRDMPEPIPQDNQVLLEIACCGICGTDLHVYHDDRQPAATNRYGLNNIRFGNLCTG